MRETGKPGLFFFTVTDLNVYRSCIIEVFNVCVCVHVGSLSWKWTMRTS